MSAATVTVPWAGWVTESIVSGPPSGSVSLASTSIWVAPEFSATVFVSLTAVGEVSPAPLTVTSLSVGVWFGSVVLSSARYCT